MTDAKEEVPPKKDDSVADDPRGTDYVAVGLTSAATIALQVALTRIFSITLWHHFAYLVVGLALLGFGSAGSYVALKGAPERGRLREVLGRRAAWAALAGFGALLVALTLRPNALELFQNTSVAVALALLVVLCTVPFFAAGLVIAASLGSWPKRAGSVYAADLVGGGLGGAASLLLLPALGALGLAAACLVALGGAGILFSLRERGLRFAVISSLTVLALSALFFSREDDWIIPAPTKELALLFQPGRKVDVEHREWTAHGRIDVFPMFKTPPLVAGEVNTPTRLYDVHTAAQDGSAPTALHKIEKDPAELEFLPHASTAAVWVARGARFGPRESHPPGGPDALIIGSGGGIDLMLALSHGAGSVTGVDINPAMLALLRKHYVDFTGGLARRPDVQLVQSDGRAFVRSTDRKFDVIQLSGVDTFTALSSGAYSVAEAYVYTREAFSDYFAHLKPGGCVSVSRLILEPPRETLRLAVTAYAALRLQGARDPAKHIIVLRAKYWATMLACDRPLTRPQLQRMRDFAKREKFALAYDPGKPQGPFSEALVGSVEARRAFFEDYPYRLIPATDETPYFFNFFKWRNLGALPKMQSSDIYASMYGTQVPIGHGVLLITFLVAIALAIAGIYRPVRRLGDALGRRKLWTGLYFACLGVGFLFVEVAFIQRLTFFLGHPTYALTAVLGALLVASGIGSALASRVRGRPRWLGVVVVGALLLALCFSYYGLPKLVGLPFAGRVALGLGLLGIVGVALGMPFPVGLARLSGESARAVPWAFAVNGFCTVLASAVAPLAALELGLSSLLVVACATYALGFVALSRWESDEPASSESADDAPADSDDGVASSDAKASA